MKYLKSTTTKSYTVNGQTIPSNKGPGWLSVENKIAEIILKQPVIKSLVNAGGIIVTDKEPEELTRDPGVLINSNAKLQLENNQLKGEVTKLQAELKIVLSKNEARAALKTAQAEIESLNLKLKQTQDELEKIQAEAKEELSKLLTENEALKAAKEDE